MKTQILLFTLLFAALQAEENPAYNVLSGCKDERIANFANTRGIARRILDPPFRLQVMPLTHDGAYRVSIWSVDPAKSLTVESVVQVLSAGIPVGHFVVSPLSMDWQAVECLHMEDSALYDTLLPKENIDIAWSAPFRKLYMNITVWCAILDNHGNQYELTESFSMELLLEESGDLGKKRVRKAPQNEPYLVFTDVIYIHQVSTDGSRLHTLVSGLTNAVALDFHLHWGYIYWTDAGNKTITKARLDGSDALVIVDSGLVAPNDMAVDWINDKLYWTDAALLIIEVLDLLNGQRVQLISTGDNSMPRAVVVDPTTRWLYWTDWGIPAKIERASMDGKNRQVLHSVNLTWPNALTLDYQTQILYWADASLDKIETSGVDGSNRRLLTTECVGHPFGITVFGDTLYWSDWNGYIGSANKSNGQCLSSIVNDTDRPSGIQVVHEQRQPTVFNPCSDSNGNCSHLCLLSSMDPRGYSCACPKGMALQSDQQNCNTSQDEPYLMFATRMYIHQVSMDGSRIHTLVSGLTNAVALDFHLYWGYIFWTDVGKKTITKARLDGSDTLVIVDSGLDIPDGMAVDWINNKLYWTDAALLKIDVLDLLNGQRVQLISTGDNSMPRAVVVDPTTRWMYWTDWGIPAKIERASMDGKNRQILHSVNLTWPNALTLDYQTQILYWADANFDKIETSGVDGSNRRLLTTECVGHPFGITVFGDTLYWSDWNGYIGSANKSNGHCLGRIVNVANSYRLFGIQVIHEERQPTVFNPCSDSNGNCSHLCLLSSMDPRGYSCACPEGMALQSDQQNCNLLVSPKEPVLEGPDTVEELETLQLKCNFSGYPAPSITWLKRDREELKSLLSSQKIVFESSVVVNLLPVTTSTLLIYNVTVADGGEYICKGDNGVYNASSSSIIIKSVTVNAKNECIVDKELNTPCQHDGVCIDHLGGYECLCTNNYTGPNCTSVVERPEPPVSPSITSPPEHIMLGLVEPVNLTCEAEGHPTPLYEWYKDNELISGANLPYLYIPAASPEDRGYYTCKAINTLGVAESTPELLTIPGIFQFTAIIEFTGIEISDTIEQTMLMLVGSSLGNPNTFIYSAKLLNTTSSANEATMLITVVSEADRTSVSVIMYIEEEFRSLSTVQLLQISRYDGCPAENTAACDLATFYSWPETEIGTAVYRPCPSADPSAQVVRGCEGTFTDGATWSEITPAENASSVAQCVCQLCSPTPDDIVNCTTESTSSPEDLSAIDISAVADNVVLLTDEAVTNSEIRNSYLQIIDSLQQANSDVILESQMDSQSSTRILDSLGKFLDELQISPNASANMEIFTQQNYALLAQDIDREVFQGETFNVDLGSFEEAINTTGDIDQDALVTMMEIVRNATGSIQVPQSVLDACGTMKNLRLSYSVFLNDILFRSPNQTANNLVIGTLVLGIRLRCALNQTLSNVSMPLTLSFRTKEGLQNANNSSCVALQTSGGFDGWSRDNCREITNSRRERLCECNQPIAHFGAHFGILFDLNPGPPLSETAALALASLTYAGLSLSLLCLTVLIITYLSSKTLRGSTHGQILVNLSFALMGMYLFFLIGGHVTPVPAICGISSALLQYFLLAFFAWTAAEAVYLYLKLVKVLGTRSYEAKFTLKAGLAAWLAPLLIVVISAGAGHKYYANSFYCRATEWPFWFGLILPFSIVYVLNWIMFLIIMVSICKHTRSMTNKNASVGSKNSIGEIKHDLMIAVSLATSLGLGWGLGLVATSSSVQEVTLVFQIIFTIFVGAQGLLIFAFHGIRSEEARKVWKAWVFAITRKPHKSYPFTHDSAAHTSGVLKASKIPSTGSYGLSTLGRTGVSQEGSAVIDSKAESSITIDETTFQHVETGGLKMSREGQLSDEATVLPNTLAVMVRGIATATEYIEKLQQEN